MIITCQDCNARFNLDDSLVKTAGSKVRCSKCKHIFVVYPEESPENEAPFSDAMFGGEGGAADQQFVPPDTDKDRSAEISVDDLQPSEDESDKLSGMAEDLDLSEIEKMLETESGYKDFGRESSGASVDRITESDEPKAGVFNADELDLSEIEKMLDIDSELDDVDAMREPEPEDLVFDLEESIDANGDDKEEIDDFELADIEKMMAAESEDDVESLAGQDASTQELDLSELEDMMDTESSETPGSADALQIETDDDAAAEAPEPESLDTTEQLDLSGLAQMIDAEASADESAEAPEEEEELTFDLDAEDEPAPAKTSGEPESSDELDFSGLDDMLETQIAPDEAQAEEIPADDATEELSLELEMDDMELVSEPEDAKTSADDFEIKFDEDTEDASDAEDEDEPAPPMATEELSLDFDDEQLDEALATSEGPEAFSGEDADGDEPVPTVAAVDEADEIEKPVAKKKRSKKPLIIVLVLLLLAAIGAGGYFFLKSSGMEMPFLNGLQKQELHDAGNLKIATIDVDSRFVENTETGRLFIITGKIRNDYSAPRSLIRISGKLFTQGKKLANTQTVYCGNVMTDLEITKMPLETIKKRLGNRTGDNNANVNVKPGEKRSFMIVFSNLPENLEEFTLVVAGSESTVPAP